jgi:hypothetical protein
MRFSILLEDQLDCKVYLRQMSEAPEAPIRPTILAIIEPSGSKGTDLARRASANTPVPVTVTDRQNLLVPGRRAWRDYVPELVGHEASDDLRVLLSRAANDQLERLSRESLSWDAEAVGFLIGQVYRDLTDELYVDIEDAVQAGNSVGKVLDQRLDAQGLQSMFYEIRQRYPGRQRIGWYHTHMIGSHRPEPVFEPDASGSRSQSFVQQVHISVADSQFHRSFFSAPWQVVLVLELKEGAKVFYQWRNDQLVRCQGYYHYERAPQSGVEK